MNIWVSNEIARYQSIGGVSTLWRHLMPALQHAMPDATFTTQLPPDLVMPTYYATTPLGVPSVVLCYDLIALRHPALRTRADVADIRRAIADATEVVSISQGTADDVKSLLGRDSTVAYCGVDETFGHVHHSDVTAFQQFIGKPYVMVVGKRDGYKNVQALYQAWRMWSAASQHRLLCVGGEDTLPQDAAFVERYGDTWWHMRLEESDLAIAYAGATALVYPSLMEGFGLPIVEAMACTCPVVADRSAAEITGGGAFLCDTTRPMQIVTALNATLDMSVSMDKVLTGTRWVKQYRWTTMAETIANVIRRVV